MQIMVHCLFKSRMKETFLISTLLDQQYQTSRSQIRSDEEAWQYYIVLLEVIYLAPHEYRYASSHVDA